MSSYAHFEPRCLACDFVFNQTELTEAKSGKQVGNPDGILLHSQCSELRYVLQHNFFGGETISPVNLLRAWIDTHQDCVAQQRTTLRPYRRASFLALHIGKRVERDSATGRNPWVH